MKTAACPWLRTRRHIRENFIFESIVAKISGLGNNWASGKHLVGYLFGDLVGGVVCSDDKVKIG
jgi:hypothetical protein